MVKTTSKDPSDTVLENVTFVSRFANRRAVDVAKHKGQLLQ